MEATWLLAKVKGDGASPASKKKSLLPHPRPEETESLLQSDGTEESFISTKQTGPSNSTRKKRAPHTPQSAKGDFLSHFLGKGERELLTISFSSSAPDSFEYGKLGCRSYERLSCICSYANSGTQAMPPSASFETKTKFRSRGDSFHPADR